MIRAIRSASIGSGKLKEALEFARDIKSYLKQSQGMEVLIAMPVAGDPNRISWTSEFKNMGDYEDIKMALMMDQKYLEIVGRSGEIFLPGSMHDEIWRII